MLNNMEVASDLTKPNSAYISSSIHQLSIGYIVSEINEKESGEHYWSLEPEGHIIRLAGVR